MRQRVGFRPRARRAPEILLMDEPFSALDVLTAETLRTDFLELWGDGKLPIKGVILVTHNIEEAVLMCDRILLFSNNPGRIIREIGVDLPQPRNRLDTRFRDLVEKIYVAMTARTAAAQAGLERQITINTVLPRVSANLFSGLIEALAAEPYHGNADLPVLADELHMEGDELSPWPRRCKCFISRGRRRRHKADRYRQAIRRTRHRRPQEAIPESNSWLTFRSPPMSAACCRSVPITWRRKAAFWTNWKIT